MLLLARVAQYTAEPDAGPVVVEVARSDLGGGRVRHRVRFASGVVVDLVSGTQPGPLSDLDLVAAAFAAAGRVHPTDPLPDSVTVDKSAATPCESCGSTTHPLRAVFDRQLGPRALCPDCERF